MAFYPRDAVRAGELEQFAKKVAILAAFLIVAAIVWSAREVVILVFIAAVLAAGISPVVHRVRVVWRHFFHRNLSRGAAVMIVYLPFLVGALALLFIMVPLLLRDFKSLGAQLPQLLEVNVLRPLERFLPMGGVRAYLAGGVSVPRSSVVLYVRNVATVIASVVAVLFMIVYMLMDAHRLQNMILLIYPPDVRAKRRATMRRIGARMSSWLMGQLILSAMMGIAIFVTLLFLRLPYALPLAIFATVGEMVPVIGPILGTAPALAIAILHSRWQFWSVLLVAVILQKIENFYVAPRVIARKVSISPLAVFIAFMTGAALLGIVGAILAIPVAAIIQVAFDEVFVRKRERRLDVDRAGTLNKRKD